MRVLIMPDYRSDNPYQTLLAEALQAQSVEVCFPQGYRRIFPIARALQDNAPIAVLHLHWLNPYLKGENWSARFVYSIKFLIDVLLVKSQGVRIVWTVHNAVSHNARFPKLELWLKRQFVKWIDRIIVHHTAAATEIAEQYEAPLAKINVIPHGHYRDVYQPAIDPLEARRQLGLPQSGKVYLNFGMLKPYKGIERLLQMWQENAVILADSTLLIVGKALDDCYGQTLIEQAAQSKNIILQNTFVEDNRIHLYFSAADVIVLPFERIFTSGSLILAMSYSKPVIAPRLGSIPETIGAADGLLYDPKTDRGLLNAIQTSTQTDLNQLSQLVAQACDRLNWNAIGEKTDALYNTLYQCKPTNTWN